MGWEYNRTSRLYQLHTSGPSLDVYLGPFSAFMKDGTLAPSDLSKFGGPSPEKNAARYCATLEELASEYGVSGAELKDMKHDAHKMLNPSSADLAVPQIERGVSLGALSSQGEWTVSVCAFYDSVKDKSYSLCTRWKNTPARVVHETLDHFSLSPFSDYRRSYFEITGIPNQARNRIRRLFQHWEKTAQN